jgi:hypothetical protein
MASFPTSVKTFTTHAALDTIEASHVNDLQDEVSAIETDLLLLTHDLKFTDATYDIGKTGATRPRDLFTSRDVSAGRDLAVARNAAVTGTLAVTGAFTAPNTMLLLHQGSGTDTNTAATNLDTYALASQLTVKDTLLIEYELEQVAQAASAAHQFYNSTDSVSAGITFGGSSMSAGHQGMGRCWLSTLQSSSKAIGQVGQSVRFAVAVSNDNNLATFTTDWTGAWTLALRSGGQTSGGTIKWKWAIYKLAGQ